MIHVGVQITDSFHVTEPFCWLPIRTAVSDNLGRVVKSKAVLILYKHNNQ